MRKKKDYLGVRCASVVHMLLAFYWCLVLSYLYTIFTRTAYSSIRKRSSIPIARVNVYTKFTIILIGLDNFPLL